MAPERVFGQVLQELRRARGLSQEQLGFESGCHRTYVSMLERGKKSPSLNMIFRVATALKIKPSEIIRRVETRADRESRSSHERRSSES